MPALNDNDPAAEVSELLLNGTVWPADIENLSDGQRAVSGATLADTECEEDDSVALIVRWVLGGRHVSVIGSFNNWEESLPLPKTDDAFGRGSLFSRAIRVRPGLCELRFLVDGKEAYDPKLPVKVDPETGLRTNVVEVKPEPGCFVYMVHRHAGPAPVSEAGDLPTVGSPVGQLAWISRVKGIAQEWHTEEEAEQAPGGTMDSPAASRFGQKFKVSILTEHKGRQQEWCLPLEGFDTRAPASDPPLMQSQSCGGDTVGGLRGCPRAEDLGSSVERTRKANSGGGAAFEGESVGRRDSSASGGKGGRPRSNSVGPPGSLSSRWPGGDPWRQHRHNQRTSEAIRPGTSVVRANVKREGKLLIAMVGLPATGKTYIGRAVTRHMEWMGMRARIFNVGNYRRKAFGADESGGKDFFSQSNPRGKAKRQALAKAALDDALQALSGDLDVAVFDATNTTRERRAWMAAEVAASGVHVQLLFLESVCTRPDVVVSNIKETKLRSPDFAKKDSHEALQDFLGRIEEYRKVYEPLEPEEGLSYVRITDAGNQLHSSNVAGYVAGRMMTLLSHLRLRPRPIYLSRAGESEHNYAQKMGGDTGLSPLGDVYASRLAEFFDQLYPAPGLPNGQGPITSSGLMVWTSTRIRAQQTVAALSSTHEVLQFRALDPLDYGLMDGMTYDTFAGEYPDEYAARRADRLHYRFPRGESYTDVFLRVEPLIMELLSEQQPVLVVAHLSVLRVIYSYLTHSSAEECPALALPLNTVIEINPKAYGCDETWHEPLA